MKRNLPEAPSRHPGCRVLSVLFAALLLLLSACGRTAGTQQENAPQAPRAEEETLKEQETFPWESEERNAEGVLIRVQDSSYQYANDYSWEDLYSLLAAITQSSPDRGSMVPAVTVVRLDPDLDPFLFAGFTDPETAVCRYEVLTMDSGYVFKLLTFEDEVFYSAREKAFYLKNAGEKYVYTPHVFLVEAVDPADWPDDTERLPIHDISETMVSIDTLPSFMLDVSGEGGAE